MTIDQLAAELDARSQVAGVTVTSKTAIQVSTVLACVKVLADGVATPPLHVYRATNEKPRELATNIPEYRLLSRRPNEWQTSYEWRRMMTFHAALTGAALSLKVRGANGRVRELIPVMPGMWQVKRTERYGVLFSVWDDFGKVGDFEPADVFHIQGLQWDWINGMDAVALARSAIGLAMATERSHVKFHENGVRSSGTWSVEGKLDEQQFERLRKVLKDTYAGPDKAGSPIVLDRSAKWNAMSMSGVDAQHIETRRLQIEEICRFYSVFPLLIGHSDKTATFASSEAFFAAHVKHTLRPWHELWTQRIDEMLLDGSGPLWAEFDTRYLTAGSMVDRASWARTMIELGIYTRNEIRDEEGKDPLPGLDEPLTPLNMTQGNGDATNP